MSTREAFSPIEVQASEWLVTLHDRTVSLEQRTRFAAWLAADPEHARIYGVQKSAWAALAGMPHLLDNEQAAETWQDSRGEGPLQKSQLQRYRLSFAAAAGVLLAVAALVLASWPDVRPDGSYATQVGQIKDIRLEDGSLMTLGASSRAEARFTEGRRQVRLIAGEAFFEVTRDTARPFFVQAGQTEVRVVGTQFDVHFTPDSVRVSVLEGRVEVTASSPDTAINASHDAQAGPAPRHVLTAGESVIVGKESQQPAVHSVSAENLGAWRTGRLVYVDATLREIIADVNRYYEGRIRLDGAAVGNLQLTTAFRVDQIDRMIDVLATALPIRAEHPDEDSIVLSLREPARQ